MANEKHKAYVYQGEKADWAVFSGLCKGCGLCIAKCPVKCMSWSKELGVYGTPCVQADPEKCIGCGICQLVCPDCAIVVERKG
jgi:MinD superfamily P-loop ATPase containing an inserted ferredoxin domain